MPSPEGEGRAKDSLETGWQAFYKVNKAVNAPLYAAFPGIKQALQGYASAKLFDLLGFWIMWRLAGGFDGLQKLVGMSRSGVFRRVALFREVFGEHPDVYEFPGITIDPVAFVTGMAERQAKK